MRNTLERLPVSEGRIYVRRYLFQSVRPKREEDGLAGAMSSMPTILEGKSSG
jgi:hypothetical protein